MSSKLSDEETTAAVRLMLVLVELPPARRMPVLAFVCKVLIERPEWLIAVAIAHEKAPESGRGGPDPGVMDDAPQRG